MAWVVGVAEDDVVVLRIMATTSSVDCSLNLARMVGKSFGVGFLVVRGVQSGNLPKGGGLADSTNEGATFGSFQYPFIIVAKRLCIVGERRPRASCGSLVWREGMSA